MLKFVPPKEDEKKVPRYASYGKGQMKLHSSVGHAKQSLANRVTYLDDSDKGLAYYNRKRLWHECFILELVDGEWFTLYHVEEGTEPNNLPWMKQYWTVLRWNGSKYWEKPTYYPDEEIRTDYESRPMTKDEYADWRVRVELERRGIIMGDG